jgi:hypothetical protein
MPISGRHRAKLISGNNLRWIPFLIGLPGRTARLTTRGEVLAFTLMKMIALRELHGARPFVPFTLTLADGRKMAVPHNEFLSLSPHGNFAVLTHADDAGFTVIDLLMVTAADFDLRAAPRRRTKKRE